MKADITSYLPKVKKGGILCGHDCENMHLANTFSETELKQDYLKDKACHPGVIQALYDIFISQKKQLEIWPDFGEFRIPIWVHYV